MLNISFHENGTELAHFHFQNRLKATLSKISEYEFEIYQIDLVYTIIDLVVSKNIQKSQLQCDHSNKQVLTVLQICDGCEKGIIVYGRYFSDIRGHSLQCCYPGHNWIRSASCKQEML